MSFNVSGVDIENVIVVNSQSGEQVELEKLQSNDNVIIWEKFEEKDILTQYIERSITSVSAEDLGDITKINSYAFTDCVSLTDIDLPESVIDIGSYAFQNCTSLTVLPDLDKLTGLMNLGSYAFSNTGAIHVRVPKLVYTTEGSFGSEMYSYCRNLLSIDFGNSTTVERGQFRYCSGLVNLIIPDTITRFWDNVFSGCSGLESVIIGNGLADVTDSSFSNCTNLKSVTFGTGVTAIRNAFTGCSNMTEWILKPTTPPSLWSSTDTIPSSVTTIYVPSSSLTKYQTAEKWSNYADKMVGV